VIISIAAVLTLECAAAIWAMKRALSKSDLAFFSIFVGDAFFKMIGLALATWWLWTRHLPYTIPLISLGLAIMALSLLQIPFFYQAK
jgi:hypothetical protein